MNNGFGNDIRTNRVTLLLLIILNLNPFTKDKKDKKFRNRYCSLISAPCHRHDADIVKLHWRDFILARPRNNRQHRLKPTSKGIHKTVCMQASTCIGHLDGQWCQIEDQGFVLAVAEKYRKNQSHAASAFDTWFSYVGTFLHWLGSCTEFSTSPFLIEYQDKTGTVGDKHIWNWGPSFGYSTKCS